MKIDNTTLSILCLIVGLYCLAAAITIYNLGGQIDIFYMRLAIVCFFMIFI